MGRSENEAIRLLKKYQIQEPPVDVYALSEQEGISLMSRDLEEDVSGLLVIKGNRAAIGFNQRHHLNRQRFTVAHELGHYFLHRNTSNLFIDKTLTFYRDEASSEGSYLQEIQANSFAAELLMPRAFLTDYFKVHRIDLHDSNAIQELASLYRVSEQALSIRLSNLGIV